ncbi:possible chemotaxis cheB/cheR fusion protein [Pseudooceanicola batsensis HTCC2597]|uniref:histidine kinase n=1 Tax=Pseudooceanicola batsensis (strain ATCC BAA-863 / DSM 15984 / KCTC 12145 / HTCC2597) TaxID=252305 RepID=A3U0I6_PSEBH|nr:CheR family methyltransferase [Pseudooceanicola batsensis]EAQ02277.1 possible chemotaxis cheB/cheR fusion protein [Pseudooceanicola batsensis HTCC2597]
MAAARTFPVVGIGASAGGLEALTQFLSTVPENAGLCFVVVTHLASGRTSSLPELLARDSKIPVTAISDGDRLQPDHVHVLPPDAIATVADGRLRLTPQTPDRPERRPIDILLGSMAESLGEYAVGVILSGRDGDGTLGLKAIKSAGGLTLAQVADGSAPAVDEMPESARSAGIVDLSLPAEEMAPRLAALVADFGKLGQLESAGQPDDLGDRLPEIAAILERHSGHDFSGYKPATFLRRIRRRMQIVQSDSAEDYVARMRASSGEPAALFRDLLIGVTAFFRDPEAFRTLSSRALSELVAAEPRREVRVWIPGCATGEEVYSIAMLLREAADDLAEPPRFRIFATDINEAALSVARAGRYPHALMSGVSEERRARFFHRDGEGWQVRKELREACVFSPHSLLRDPPFSRMDLVSCRNLLIYFGPETQRKVLPALHYALRPGGFLFLGTAEGIGRHDHLFETVDKRQRLFRAREGRRRAMPSAGDFDGLGPTSRAGSSPPLRHAVEARVLERYAPPHVVVDGDGEVLHFSARTGRFLEAPAGLPSRNLMSIARRGLRADISATLAETQLTGRPAHRTGLVMAEEDEDGPPRPVSITAEPLTIGGDSPQFLVLFTPAPEPPESDGSDAPALTAHLEAELRTTRDRLQTSTEEYETALEELKATNEELHAVNEEAQSTNEELEASQEEMQSLNEELATINAELSDKIEGLDRANADLQNLFDSSRVATVFLDHDLTIRNYTPTASTFFNLRAADVGRPLTDLASRLDYPEFSSHLAQVLETGKQVEHQLSRDADGRHHVARLFPYRYGDDSIRGVVVTFLDVTGLAEAEARQEVLISELNHRVKNILGVVVSVATRTRQSSDTFEGYYEVLLGRLYALGRSYGILSKRNWVSVGLKDIVAQEVQAHGPERFDIDGEAVMLDPMRSLALGIVLHELMTNALKYGALSDAEGRVAITWRIEADTLVLDWTESGGPKVAPPREGGFGLSLIEGQIGYQLGGRVERKFAPAGLTLRLHVPLTNTPATKEE